jgi:hypothetical protein
VVAGVEHDGPVTWTAPEVKRTDPPTRADERTALDAWLDFHRTTLLAKCQGLTGEQLVERAVAPSSLTLLGLVRHMTEVERAWFRRRFGGQPELGSVYCTDDTPDADFDLVEADGAEAGFATFVTECEMSRRIVADRSLDETFEHPRLEEPIDLRWVYIHMIEEYARHNGHADILREQIDGVTGA